MNFTIAALPCPRKFCAGSSRVAFGASRLSIAAESCAFQARKYAATTASPLSGTGGFFSTAQANRPAATRDPKAYNFFVIRSSNIEIRDRRPSPVRYAVGDPQSAQVICLYDQRILAADLLAQDCARP